MIYVCADPHLHREEKFKLAEAAALAAFPGADVRSSLVFADADDRRRHREAYLRAASSLVLVPDAEGSVGEAAYWEYEHHAQFRRRELGNPRLFVYVGGDQLAEVTRVPDVVHLIGALPGSRRYAAVDPVRWLVKHALRGDTRVVEGGDSFEVVLTFLPHMTGMVTALEYLLFEKDGFSYKRPQSIDAIRPSPSFRVIFTWTRAAIEARREPLPEVTFDAAPRVEAFTQVVDTSPNVTVTMPNGSIVSATTGDVLTIEDGRLVGHHRPGGVANHAASMAAVPTATPEQVNAAIESLRRSRPGYALDSVMGRREMPPIGRTQSRPTAIPDTPVNRLITEALQEVNRSFFSEGATRGGLAALAAETPPPAPSRPFARDFARSPSASSARGGALAGPPPEKNAPAAPPADTARLPDVIDARFGALDLDWEEGK